MEVDFEKLQSELSEVEMALLVAVNAALNATIIAGADPNVTLQHLSQHRENFRVTGQSKAEHVIAAIEMLHKNTAGA